MRPCARQRPPVGAGGEIELRARPSIAVVPEFDGPQPINNDRFWWDSGLVERKDGGGVAIHWIERIDLAVTEIPDQQLATQFTEARRRRERQAPGRVNDSPYAKGNFAFDRVVCGWRRGLTVLDLRLKR